MSKDKGYILLHRSIQNSEIWIDGGEFNQRDAWIDLLLLTQHSEYRGIQRGQCATSQYWLAKRWGWSRKRVTHYLHHLESLGMVTINSTREGTTITIVNYDKFQGKGTTKGTTKGTNEGTTKGTTKGTQTKNVCTSNVFTMNGDTIPGSAQEVLFDPQGRKYE